jgi:Protein of unknown function (DUF3616)
MLHFKAMIAIGLALPLHSHAQPPASAARASAAAPTVPFVRPNGEPLRSRIGFPFKEKTRRAASGVACSARNGVQQCLVAFDEGKKAHFAQLGPGTFDPLGVPITLSDSDGELDAEGAATDGEFYYVIGSHSVKRESCASNPASRALTRFKASWPAVASEPQPKVQGLQLTDRLWKLINADAYLGRHADGCLGDGRGPPEQQAKRPGLNIEGLAVKDGRLYVGFRAPSKDGVVPVYSVDSRAVFDESDAKARLARLQVGAGLGIRDMVAGRDAVLLLVGPDDRKPTSSPTWSIAEWPDAELALASSRPRLLAKLDLRNLRFQQCFEELKPEAIAILDESSAGYRILVLSDGVCDGGALVFDLKK